MSDVYGLTKRMTVPVRVEDPNGHRGGYWLQVHLVTYDGNWEEFETEGIYVEGSHENLEPLLDGSTVYDWVVEKAATELYEEMVLC